MANGYAYNAAANEAKAIGVAMPISFKSSVEVCRWLRGQKVEQAYKMLDRAAALKEAVPFTRYFEEIAHQKNVGPGKFPVKACTYIKRIIESAEKNAQFKGLNSSNLIIKHIAAQSGGKVFHQGRNGRQGKNAHIEVVLAEGMKTEKKVKKEGGKAAPKK